MERKETVRQIEEKIFRKVGYLKEIFERFPLFEKDCWKDFEHWVDDSGLEILVENIDQAGTELIDWLQRRHRAIKIEKIRKALQSALERGELTRADFPGEGFNGSGLCFHLEQGQIIIFDDKEDLPF
jgi:hypothetical protein